MTTGNDKKIETIDLKRWEEAQEGELDGHIHSYDSTVFPGDDPSRQGDPWGPQDEIDHYKEKSYPRYFDLMEIDTDLNGKHIVEIGCALVSGLEQCSNGKKTVIEPLIKRTDNIHVRNTISRMEECDISILAEPAEHDTIPECDEVWIFNLLQHVISPEKILTDAMSRSKVIRFFEPLEQQTHIEHPHTLTKKFFDSVLYEECDEEKSWAKLWLESDVTSQDGFHQWSPCYYGVWHRKEETTEKESN